MTREPIPLGSEGFDIVGASVGGALVSGGLSLLAPSLGALIAPLAALALAGWLSLVHRSTVSVRHTVQGTSGWALVSLGIGAFCFLEFRGGFSAYRALALAVSLVPLWAVARRVPLGSP